MVKNIDGIEIENGEPLKLSSKQKPNIWIPSDFFLESVDGKIKMTKNENELVVLSYLYFHKPIGNEAIVNIDDIVIFLGFKPNINKNKINDKVISIINELVKKKYISYCTKIKSSFYEIGFDLDVMNEMRAKRDKYAIVYNDEIEKISNYKKRCQNSVEFEDKDLSLPVATIYKVFIYLRTIIPRRSNKPPISMEYECASSFMKRRATYPDAYSIYLKDLANALQIKKETLNKAIKVLKHLEIIYYYRPKTIKHKETGDKYDKFWVQYTIFCNFDKREKGQLISYGSSYYSQEVDCKIDNMRRYFFKTK